VIIRTFKASLRVLAAISSGLAIFLLLLAWQLSQGPISLGFLSPYIQNMVNKDQSNFSLSLSDTILTWAGWDRSLDIRVLDVQVFNLENEVVGNIPELSFSLDRSALLKGEIAPNSVELFGPKLHLIRQIDGSMNIRFGKTPGEYGAPTLATFQDLLDGPEGEHPLRHLKSLNIINADVSVDDQIFETSWMAPSADIYLSRDALGVQGQISLVLDVEGKQTELELIGRYKTVDRILEITADIDKISLAPFASVFDDIKILKKFNVPLKGSVALSFPVFGGSHSVHFDVKGDRGQLNLPEPFNNTVNIKSVAIVGAYYDATGQTEISDIQLELSENKFELPTLFDGTLDIKTLVLAGSYSSKTGITRIQEMHGQMGPNWKVDIPAPFNHKIPLRSFSLSGIYDEKADWLNVSKFVADLNGPKVLIKGSVAGAFTESETVVVEFDGEFNNVPVNDMSYYWPKLFWPDVYDWINKNLTDGTLSFVKANSRLSIPKQGELEVEFIEGSAKLTGVSVDYLPPMPKGQNISADIVFNHEAMDVILTKGHVSDIKMHEGNIAFRGLNDVDQYAEINLTMDGSVRSTLAFIDNKPLGFASKLGIDPKNSLGKARTDLSLKFIIENNLTVDSIDIQATSKLTNLTLNRIFTGHGIHDSTLDLKIDKKGMMVTGDVNFASIPAQLVWSENFEKNHNYQSRYDFAVALKDVSIINDLGFDIFPFPDKYLNGSIGTNIRFTVFDDVDRRLEIQADITETALQLSEFSWSKAAGVEGHAEIIIDFERDAIVDIPEFKIIAADMEIYGKASYVPKGDQLTKIEFDQLIFGRNNVKGAMILQKNGGWDIDIQGSSFDFSAYWDELFSSPLADKDKKTLLDNVTIAIEVDKIWVSDTQSMEKVSGTFLYQDEIWRSFILSSYLNSGAIFDLSIQPGEDGNRQMSLQSDNAGDALRFLNFYDSMQGGKLTITGKYQDNIEGYPLIGNVSVEDFRVVDAPILAHVLNIMALTGILDALSGDGIGFSSLEIPFLYHEGVLQLKSAQANGTSLGFTAKGHVYRDADLVDIHGTVVPAYALNSVLGHIPVLGKLLTGGEKGGGIFAANYSMSGSIDEPKILVNPLSALTPGFLRNVFGVFEKAIDEPKFVPGDNLKISTPN
jgi:hypothetical protein